MTFFNLSLLWIPLFGIHHQQWYDIVMWSFFYYDSRSVALRRNGVLRNQQTHQLVLVVHELSVIWHALNVHHSIFLLMITWMGMMKAIVKPNSRLKNHRDVAFLGPKIIVLYAYFSLFESLIYISILVASTSFIEM